MFTSQANQLATAMRTAGGNPQSAQEMLQAMCNCTQTLEHRGPVDFNYTDPWFANYPTTSPPPGRFEPLSPASGNAGQEVNVNFPPIPGVSPWKPMTWTNIPPIDVPSGTALSYPWGPGYGLPNAPGSFAPWVPNPGVESAGPISAPQVSVSGPTYTNRFYTQNVTNYGDTYIEGDTVNEGDMYIGGDTTIEGDTYNGGGVVIAGPTKQNGPVTTTNYTYNFAPQHHYSANWFFGPVNIKRNVRIRVGGQPLQFQEQNVVTRVAFKNNVLRATTRRLRYVGTARAAQVKIVFTVVNGGASFDPDTCEIIEDNGENPQITFVKSIDPPA